MGSDNGLATTRRQAINNLYQWWLVYWRIYICVTRPQWVIYLVATIPVDKGQGEVIYVQIGIHGIAIEMQDLM